MGITLKSSLLNSKIFTDWDFKAKNSNSFITDGAKSGAERPSNAFNFGNAIAAGETIAASKIVEFINALNEEINTRSSFFENVSQYPKPAQVSLIPHSVGKVIYSNHYNLIRNTLSTYVGDNINMSELANNDDFKKILNNQANFYFSYKQYFGRLVYKCKSMNVDGNVINFEFEQIYNWWNLTDEFNSAESKINQDWAPQLKTIFKNIKDSTKEKIVIGIADIGSLDIKWFNNVKLEPNCSFTETSEDYNADKKLQKRVTRKISLKLRIDSEIEFKMQESLTNAIITAERINKYRDYLNRLRVACLCDCNYCTCDCNYCTCDCNYCTCDCNYCTCDCNYCTCDCNNATCPTNAEYSDSVNTWYDYLYSCSCNVNSYWCGGHGEYGGTINEQNYGKSSPDANNQYATHTEVCSCNVDAQWDRKITGKAIWEKSIHGQIDNNPGDIDNQSSYTNKQVCTCDTNAIIQENCATNQNIAYVFKNENGVNVSVKTCVCDVNKDRQVICQAHSDFKTVQDSTQFPKP